MVGEEEEARLQPVNAPQPFIARWPIETPHVNMLARD